MEAILLGRFDRHEAPIEDRVGDIETRIDRFGRKVDEGLDQIGRLSSLSVAAVRRVGTGDE